MFTAKEVCAALNVPRGTLNSWAHAGYFKQFDTPATNQGKARIFTWNDLLRLAIFKLLTDNDISAKSAILWAWVAVEYMKTESQYRVAWYPDRMALVSGNRKAGPDALLELTIFPHAIAAHLRQRLNLPVCAPDGAPTMKSGTDGSATDEVSD
jgi:hypothetical protein